MKNYTLDPRRAGEVLRFHTWRVNRQQSVAEHCWNVARVLLAIWPEAPPRMVKHALFHDIGEVVTGDLPYPVKKDNPQVGAAMDRMEVEAYLQMSIGWSLPPPGYLEGDDKTIFKTAEYLEGMEWALDELYSGNKFATLVAERWEVALSRVMAELVGSAVRDAPLCAEVHQRAKSYLERRKRSYDADRTPD